MAKKKETPSTFEVDGKQYKFVYRHFTAKVFDKSEKFDAEALLSAESEEEQDRAAEVLSWLVDKKASVITEVKEGGKQ